MTTQEFSDAFDVLLNSHAETVGHGIPGGMPTVSLDEYEKSVLLTEAQQDVVQGLYNGALNGRAFEETEELRSALQGLIRTATPEAATDVTGVSGDSSFFTLPSDVWFITYESVALSSGSYCNDTAIEVVPMRQDEWHRAKRNPFRQPSERRAVRLDCGQGIVEIIAAYPIASYTVRYLRKPRPIILVDLTDPLLSIDGRTEVTECELGVMLHRPILMQAVRLALLRYTNKK